MTTDPTQANLQGHCAATAEVVDRADGRSLGFTLTCDGSREHLGQHYAVLTWHGERPDADLADPDEDFDVELDALPHDVAVTLEADARPGVTEAEELHEHGDELGILHATVDVEGEPVTGTMVGPRCEAVHPGLDRRCTLTRYHRGEHTTGS